MPRRWSKDTKYVTIVKSNLTFSWKKRVYIEGDYPKRIVAYDIRDVGNLTLRSI